MVSDPWEPYYWCGGRWSVRRQCWEAGKGLFHENPWKSEGKIFTYKSRASAKRKANKLNKEQ